MPVTIAARSPLGGDVVLWRDRWTRQDLDRLGVVIDCMISPVTEDFIPHLVRFLRSQHYKLCRHGFVELYPTEARVWRQFGRRQPRMRVIQ